MCCDACNLNRCYLRSKTDLGTSTQWPKTAGCNCNFWLEDGTVDQTCHCAYLPYGDGASFTGYREDPWTVQDWPPFDNSTHAIPQDAALWFRGIRNYDATIDWLLARGMDQADEIVLSGGSAGGLATFLHMDRLAARMKQVNSHTIVRAVPVVGYFLDHDNFAHTSQTYPNWMDYITTMQHLTAAADGNTRRHALMPTCTAHYEPAR